MKIEIFRIGRFQPSPFQNLVVFHQARCNHLASLGERIETFGTQKYGNRNCGFTKSRAKKENDK